MTKFWSGFIGMFWRKTAFTLSEVEQAVSADLDAFSEELTDNVLLGIGGRDEFKAVMKSAGVADRSFQAQSLGNIIGGKFNLNNFAFRQNSGNHSAEAAFAEHVAAPVKDHLLPAFAGNHADAFIHAVAFEAPDICAFLAGRGRMGRIEIERHSIH
jgi:hypothetical protein